MNRLTTLIVLFACALAQAADIRVGPNEDPSAKANQVQNGDTLIIADGNHNGTITLKNKSNVTITAENVGTITIARLAKGAVIQRADGTQLTLLGDTPWASGTKATINAKNASYGINLEGCNAVTVRGLTVTGARDKGIRPVNCNNLVIEDSIVEGNGDGMRFQQSPEDTSKRTNPKGHKIRRFVAQGNGGHGFAASFNSEMEVTNTGSFYNNRGWHENLWGGGNDGGRLINGKWFAFVQNSGGGGKWVGCDKVTFDRHWCEANNGYGLWFDWIDSNIIVRHSYFGPGFWNQNDYDDCGLHFEICEGPGLVEDCFFNGSVFASQISESHNNTFRNNIFAKGAIQSRNQEGRNDGIRNLLYENNTIVNGVVFHWWGGLQTEALRAGRNVRLVNNQNVATAPAWNLDWNGQPTPGPTPNPTPAPTDAPQPTDGGEFLTTIPVGTVNGWGPAELNRSNGEKNVGDGKAITLGGKTYDKGIGLHSAATVPIVLTAKYKALRAMVGIDGESGNAGSATVQVWSGTTKLYETPVMKGGQAPVSIDVPVIGLGGVTLIVTNGGDNVTSDHVSLGFLRFIPSDEPAPQPTTRKTLVPGNPYPIEWEYDESGKVTTGTTRPAN